MDIYDYSIKNAELVAIGLGADTKSGLDKKTVAERLAAIGPNKLELQATTGWNIFLRQFKSSFIYLLLAAMAITIALGHVVDTLMIFTFIAINAGLGFYQEYSSEKTAQLLSKFALPRAKVLRAGTVEQTTADQLVPGDIVVLGTGDKVPADIRLLQQSNLSVDETVLTGESLPVYKQVESLSAKPNSYQQATNMAFSGTDVLKGEARGVVVATGKHTAFGQIAKLAGESRKESDFERGISRFSGFILKLVGITLLAVFSAHLLISRDGISIYELIIFSVALTVSVIPEALPLVTTFSLSRSAKHLAKRSVIVKRLSAIEDLGGIEILCSDKTGTLTENKLSIARVYPDPLGQTVWLANLASSFDLKQKIEPFDIALEQGLNPAQKQQIASAVKISEEPFDPKTRKNSVLVKDGDKHFFILRGAPETVIASCAGLSPDAKAELEDWISSEGRAGHRVLAVGHKEIPASDLATALPTRMAEAHDFQFCGMVSFVDPIKESAVSAIRQARALGVKIMVITGDSPEVAGAVAHEIGLIDSPDKVITGNSWKNASPAEQDAYLDQHFVFARVSPAVKFDIIEALHKRYMIGFLGEGINDAPGLKTAGVAMVVDSAADIAREASDIILLKKNLAVIVDGIKEGRRVFANTTKYIKSTLASNFGNFFAVATASLMIDFLPMLPIQILLVNLLSDTPMISISTDNVESGELKSPRKYNSKDIIIIAMILGLVSTVFDFMFFGLFYNISPEVLQTNWFIGSILTELVLLFSIRTRSPFFRALRPSGLIIWLSMITVALTIGLPFTTFGQQVFKFVPPTPSHLAWILSLVATYFIVSETIKLLYYNNKANQ